MSDAKILIVDDVKNIAEAVSYYLKAEGYETITAADGMSALAVLDDNDIDLIIMDVMMPELDGIQTTKRIRDEHNIPIIMLSARSEDYDKVMGLNIGADDYVTKPFNPMELIARVNSQLRRYRQLGSAKVDTDECIYRIGGLEINDDAKAVTVDGEPVSLTPTEYGILLLLASNPGRVYSIDQIYEAVWGDESYNSDNTVAVHIRRIREKIEIDPKNPRYLKVVWGVGYKVDKTRE